MKIRLLSAVAFVLALIAGACAQNAPSGQPPAQAPGSGGWQGGQGRGGGRGGWGGMMGAGPVIGGIVSEVAADHYIIKTDNGETYTVHFSVNTRIMKQPVQRRGPGGGAEGADRQPPAPQMLKSTDIKVGDAIGAFGEVDAAAKSIGAVTILQVDPERARQMREIRANYGKTWLIGKVTAIDEAKVTLMGSVDNAVHAFQADENTAFRKHHAPITLADIQPGDVVRVEGAVQDGIFVAASVSVMEMPPGGTPAAPRDAPPAPQPK